MQEQKHADHFADGIAELRLLGVDQVRLNSLDFSKLWLAIEAEARTLDAALPAPLRIAKVMTSDWFDPELFAALCGANLGNAIERMAKYMRLIAPMAVKVERRPTRAMVTIDFSGSDQDAA
ncbi:AraC family transcriptional regulator ligand-binding domain-containing protein [Rhizobium oryziradicis]|uniref:Uncharacterized protein n=1 Tax=Rhizobium oryziradicis TaxID=1867956 RepID=A0A1Q8ZS67_9HYPH|nr:AraC family transcriptional regulator ligand-binding domain-containing protein [Rhizobium oryziradicis]OLP44938.1 hypothetical protein BJF95_05000 [Rhizobium oryziradicis]